MSEDSTLFDDLILPPKVETSPAVTSTGDEKKTPRRPRLTAAERLQRQRDVEEPKKPEAPAVTIDKTLAPSVDGLCKLLLAFSATKEPLVKEEKEAVQAAALVGLSQIDENSAFFKWFPIVSSGIIVVGVFAPRYFPRLFGREIPVTKSEDKPQ